MMRWRMYSDIDLIQDALTLLSRMYFSSSLRKTFSSLVRSRLPLMDFTSFQFYAVSGGIVFSETVPVPKKINRSGFAFSGVRGHSPLQTHLLPFYREGKWSVNVDVWEHIQCLVFFLQISWRFAGSGSLRGVIFEPITPYPAIVFCFCTVGISKRK